MTALLASSVFIVAAVVPLALVISTMAGFAIGLLRIPGARLLLILFVFGLTLPFEGIITPLYFLARQIGILNTRLAIVLPLIGLFMPFAVFWMRAHFVNMPSEITEAARVDGASTWDVFWRIHVPLARAPIASLGILMSVWAWNQFLLALVLVEDPTQRTMAGALGAFSCDLTAATGSANEPRNGQRQFRRSCRPGAPPPRRAAPSSSGLEEQCPTGSPARVIAAGTWPASE